MIFKKSKKGEQEEFKDGWRMICPEITIKEVVKEEETQPNLKGSEETFKSVYDMSKRAVK
ncbi:MAG TPA: hypothetical protein VMW81_09685 [Nitrospinota bacterium]|nr:hypothetical protein [Nitrospinota bacterium]